MSGRQNTPILSGALACTQWECDLGLAAVHSALPNTPSQLAVLELPTPEGQVGCGFAGNGLCLWHSKLAEKCPILVLRDCCCFGASLLL